MTIKKILIGAALVVLSLFLISSWSMRQTRQQETIPKSSSEGTPVHETPSPVTSTSQELIHVSTPRPNDVVRNPLLVEGEARGSWYFEASFPIKILDAKGKLLGSTPAQAQGEWMTKEFVPFKAELSFVTSTTETGELVLEKDNPSGLPEHADEIRIPIRFDLSTTNTQPIKLYYYVAKDVNQQDQGACSTQGLEAVQRKIPGTKTPIADTIRLLLEGTNREEEDQGITTEFPLPGVELKTASLKNGVLTLTFLDPRHATSGGACRATMLRTQIEETAKQFPGVTGVRFLPVDVFQP